MFSCRLLILLCFLLNFSLAEILLIPKELLIFWEKTNLLTWQVIFEKLSQDKGPSLIAPLTVRHWKGPCVSLLQFIYSFFFFLPAFVSFWQQKRQHFLRMNITVTTQASRNPSTSNEWYWTQLRSWAATRRCLAPLWRMTNSTQKTALSRGFTGWSWWILDNRMAFSL